MWERKQKYVMESWTDNENIHPGAIYNLMGFGCGNHSRVLEKYNRDSILEIENVTSQTMG